MKIFIEYQDNKFINNILLSQIDKKISILSSEINKDMYKIHDQYNMECYILNSKHLISNREILQFIEEYHNKLKIVIYHEDQTTHPIIGNNTYNIYHIGYDDIDNIKYKKIPKLLNRALFSNFNKEHLRHKKIVCFVDNAQTINKINKLLYPNSSLPIILFGNMSHPQCLGKINEKEKSLILNNYEYYLSTSDNDYMLEASECGCKVFTTDSILESKAMVNIDTSSILSYSEFIEELVAI